MKIRLVYSIVLLILLSFSYAQTGPSANAGNDFTICPGGLSTLGGSPTASGGTPPYTYNWTPTLGLSSFTVANPVVTISTTTTFYLVVTDSLKKSKADTITVTYDPIDQFGAGHDTSVCLGGSVKIGAAENAGAGGYNFSWTPSTGLDNPALGNPTSTPPGNMTYTLTVSDAFCSAQSKVNVYIRFISLIADHDTTINEGNTITLHASGANSYSWTPVTDYIKYPNTATPDVNPINSITYTVSGMDASGCYGQDTLRVNVIPGDDLFFYSAFTPNHDGDNDFFYIGNIAKYPDNLLKIYNRYGQVIFTSSGYNNDWDGSYQGNVVPTGTYFYILDTGTDKGKYKGTVTILR
ncbi:MAG: T9SS type B sorting domain-containing protein [Bacteroidia bacterium]